MDKNRLLFEQYTDNCELYTDRIDSARVQLQIWLNQKWYNNFLIVHCDDGDYKFEYNKKREPINTFIPTKKYH